MEPTTSEALGKELARLVRFLRRPATEAGEERVETMAPDVFRAVVAQRLRALEREVADTRGRINGLLFVVLGAVITQVMLRVI
jgi:hypothetical protein